MESLRTVLSESDARAYAAIGTTVAWFDAPQRWTRFQGAKSADVLNGLITNDVATLRVKDTLFAAALSPKGKLVCDMFVVRTSEDEFYTGIVESAHDAWRSLVRKYVNPRLSTVTDESESLVTFAVLGVGAADIAHAIEQSGVLRAVARIPIAGAAPGFLLIVPVGDADAVRHRLADSRAHEGSPSLWNVVRVEAGWPLIGVDMDENTLPQEANLDALGAISFTKGCYPGQETVARIHFRGHVNRHLRGLIANAPMSRGATLLDASEKTVGDVRSAVLSPRLGHIALAMVRREVGIGDVVRVMSHGADGEARVCALPIAETEALA
jgi:folate-binding protein YgfZ